MFQHYLISKNAKFLKSSRSLENFPECFSIFLKVPKSFYNIPKTSRIVAKFSTGSDCSRIFLNVTACSLKFSEYFYTVLENP